MVFTIFYFHAFYKLIRGGISEQDWGGWRSQGTGEVFQDPSHPWNLTSQSPGLCWAVLPQALRTNMLDEWMSQQGPRALFIEHRHLTVFEKELIF